MKCSARWDQAGFYKILLKKKLKLKSNPDDLDFKNIDAQKYWTKNKALIMLFKIDSALNYPMKFFSQMNRILKKEKTINF